MCGSKRPLSSTGHRIQTRMIAAAILLALAIPLQAQTPPRPQTLDAMRDTYRPLLIFARNGDPALARQMQMLANHRAELVDRKVMLVLFPHKYAGAWNQEIEASLVREEDSLRRRFQVPANDFTVILIGKDGGEKFRSHLPITIEQLIRIIDAMPMRQQESRSRHTP